MFRLKLQTRSRQLLTVLVLSSLVSFGFFVVRAISADSLRYWFLNWNLILAWLPLALAYALKRQLKVGAWTGWQGLILSVLWLGFLPNSFYIVSDLIHLHATGEISILFDIVMFISFVLNGFVLGFASLYLVHLEFLKHLRRRDAHGTVVLILLASSFAIYLGRYLRWNSWDLLVNPAGLLFEVSDRFLDPRPQLFTTTAMFFVLLGGMYVFIWRVVQILETPEPS